MANERKTLDTVEYRPRPTPRLPKAAEWPRRRRRAHLAAIDKRLRQGGEIETGSLEFVMDELDMTMREANTRAGVAFVGGLGVGAIVASVIGWSITRR